MWILQSQSPRKTMRVIAKLPDRFFYTNPVKRNDKWICHDLESPLYRIISPVKDPFDKEWTIKIVPKNNAEGRKPYPSELLMICHPLSAELQNLPRARIDRDQYTGNFAYSSDANLFFAATGLDERSWLTIAVVRINQNSFKKEHYGHQ